MMDISNFLELYWNYYLQLEEDFFALEPFCTIDELNDNTFSVKYLQLILSICGEIDTICKRFCSCLDPSINSKYSTINDYRSIILKYFPQITKEIVNINQHIYYDVQPWQSWANLRNPDWWNTYNQIKHHRDEIWKGKETYKHANQKATIEALCALYIVLEYWAVYNFVLNNNNNNSPEMIQIWSRRICLKNWHGFYRYFMGMQFFETKDCRTYFKIEDKSTDGDTV